MINTYRQTRALLYIVCLLILPISGASQAKSTSVNEKSHSHLVIPDNNTQRNSTGDISYQKLTNRHPDCAEYVGNYWAQIVDVQQGLSINSYLTITANQRHCTFTSNNIPNHDVGHNTTTGKNFSSMVKANAKAYILKVPRQPEVKESPTYIQKGRVNSP